MTEETERVVIRDNRKIDPVTGEPRRKGGGAPAGPHDPAGVPVADATTAAETATVDAALLDERTADLQRVQAEYANYRKRADRDRLAAGDLAVGRVLAELLPVIDDLDRARAHDDLAGPLKAVADKLDGVFAKVGIVAFGVVGDPFDPAIHEAVLHDESDSVDVPTCTVVMRQGYRHGERLLRPAMVGVTDPLVFAPLHTEPLTTEPLTTEPLGTGTPGTETPGTESLETPLDEPADDQFDAPLTEPLDVSPSGTGAGGLHGDDLGGAVERGAHRAPEDS